MTIKLVLMAAVYCVMLLAPAVSAFARSGKGSGSRRVPSA
jgi:hypothetical protein